MSSNNVTLLPEAHCPVCANKLDAASPTQGAPAPEPGDVSICFYCTALLEFNENLIPELMSEETHKSLEPATLAELLRVRNAIREIKQPNLH
jgi:hypothetical protein